MKIFLPFKVKDIGGTSTFARKFKEGMEAAGHEVTFEWTPDYDVLFLIVQCPLKYLLDAKRRGKKIVQRLDGTYYWSVSGWKFPLMNAKAAYIRHFFTDFTIYQSEYSQDCANRFLGRKWHDPSAIIYNGVDLALFNPEGQKKELRDNPSQRVFFTASAFRRRDQIIPVVEGFKAYQKKYDGNSKLVIAGTFSGAIQGLPAALEQEQSVQLVGKVRNSELPLYARAADVFLFTHLNPPCPNNIIESLACGLPICGLADGAMSEIVTPAQNGELLPVHGSGFWTQRRFDPEAFADALHLVLTRPKYRLMARQAACERFSLSGMVDRYVKSLRSLVE